MSDLVAMPMTGVRLEGSTTWPAWYQQLRAHCQSKTIWAEVNPKADELSASELKAPKRPTLADDASDDDAKTRAYDRSLAEWRSDITEWNARMSKHANVRSWITATVDADLLTAALMEVSPDDDSEPTNQKLVQALMTELAPSSTSTLTTVRMQYRAHLELARAGTMEPREWYRQWKSLYLRAKALSLAEIDGQLGTLDLLAALTVKYAPAWANNMHDQILAQGVMGGPLPSLSQVGQLFSQKLEDHAMRHPIGSGAYATLGGSDSTKSPKQGGRSPKAGQECPCTQLNQPGHQWSPETCGRLRSVITGEPYRARSDRDKTLTAGQRQQILNNLHKPRWTELRATLAKKHDIPKKAPAEKPAREPGATSQGIIAALIDPALLLPVSSGVYATMEFDAHPLSRSTILDNGAAIHLVNTQSLLVAGSFKKSAHLETVEAGTQAFPISGRGTRVIKNVVHGERGERTEDLTLHQVAVVEGFHVNIVSEARLKTSNVWYLGLDETLRKGTLAKNVVLMSLQRHHNLTFIEYNLLNYFPESHTVMSVTPRNNARSWDTHARLDSEDLWHARGGHLGPEALRALVYAARGVRLHGTPRLKCEDCAVTHATQVISRRPRTRSPRPYWRIAWDLFDMPGGRLGEQWLLIIKDDYSGRLHLYVTQQKSILEIMRVFRHFSSWLLTQYHLRIANISQDNDQSTLPWRGTSEYKEWCADNGIDIKPTPPHTHEPNGSSERAGQEVITKALKMRLGANLPEKLWPEVTQAAVWLYNMSPAHRNNLRSPNEVLLSWFQGYFKYYQPAHVRNASDDLRPDWSGVHAYGCRAYPLNRERAAGLHRRGFKVSPRAHIGYLVGYKASNIYRIWVPTLERVITTRNVTFDETLFFSDKKFELARDTAVKVVDVLHEDEIRDSGAAFDHLSSPSTERTSQAIPMRSPPDNLGGAGTLPDDSEHGPSQDDRSVPATSRGLPWAGEDQRIREERAQGSNQLLSPEPTPEPEARGGGDRGDPRPSGETDETRSQQQTLQGQVPREPSGSTSARLEDEPVGEVAPGAEVSTATGTRKSTRTRKVYEKTRSSRRQQGDDPDDPTPPSGAAFAVLEGEAGETLPWQVHALLEGYARDDTPYDLRPEHTTLHAVVANATTHGRLHRDELPKPPKRWKDLAHHPMGKEFKEACDKEIDQLISMNTWQETTRSAHDPRPLPLMWVLTYKCDEDGYFAKCKARLVVRGDMQAKDSLQSTYAATLAARSFRLAMAIAAEFDLEIRQYDVVGAFLNAHINTDSPVLCELPEGYQRPGMCVQLKRALYGLRESPLLWYNEFSSKLKGLGLIASKEEPCLFFSKERRVLVLFYVDDILVMYHARDNALGRQLTQAIQDAYQVEDRGEVSWFLGIRVVRDRSARTISLVHDTYIDKVAKRFDLAETGRFPETPLPSAELIKHDGEASKKDIKSYQERVGSVLYTAIMIRPDVSFAVAQLSQFLTNPSPAHMKSVEHLIVYLHRTRAQAIQYGGGRYKDAELAIYGDASFADDEDTRRSSHGYVMMLFGGPISWKAARQPTVTTSTTEAELLSLAHVAKETMALKRLFHEVQLITTGAWSIFCDNQQTIRLVTGENERVTTRLRHVDIQNMWLRQEHRRGSFDVVYLATVDMVADGLTKYLPKQKFEHFKHLLNLTTLDLTSFAEDQQNKSTQESCSDKLILYK
jgi:hypothetical protein